MVIPTTGAVGNPAATLVSHIDLPPTGEVVVHIGTYRYRTLGYILYRDIQPVAVNMLRVFLIANMNDMGINPRAFCIGGGKSMPTKFAGFIVVYFPFTLITSVVGIQFCVISTFIPGFTPGSPELNRVLTVVVGFSPGGLGIPFFCALSFNLFLNPFL